MAEQRIFNGFFSYAHHDGQSDPSLITDFTTRLESRVASRLTNARFAIWRDKDALRVGERWNDKIEAQLRSADVLIVLLTPRWIESDYCRKEYSIFEEVEAARTVGEYVVPILARPIEQQEKYFTPQQKDIYERIAKRQRFNAIDFISLPRARRNAEIDKMADDVAGMIDRLRDLAITPGRADTGRRYTAVGRQKEFTARAENYAEVDFLRSSEVGVDRAQGRHERAVYAQVDFVERLYVKSNRAYIEFGIRHAILSVSDAGEGELRQSDVFRSLDPDRAAYVSLQDMPDAISVAMYANPERGLAELALPPTEGNYWSQIATATPEVQQDRLLAELRVSFSRHGLYMADAKAQPLSPATKRKIEAIIGVAIEKQERVGDDGRMCRSVPVRERML
jgi:TIR domain